MAGLLASFGKICGAGMLANLVTISLFHVVPFEFGPHPADRVALATQQKNGFVLLLAPTILLFILVWCSLALFVATAVFARMLWKGDVRHDSIQLVVVRGCLYAGLPAQAIDFFFFNSLSYELLAIAAAGTFFVSLLQLPAVMAMLFCARHIDRSVLRPTNTASREAPAVFGPEQDASINRIRTCAGAATDEGDAGVSNTNTRRGTTLDGVLGQEGIREAAETEARTRVAAGQLSREIETRGISTAALAEPMHGGRVQVDRILRAEGHIGSEPHSALTPFFAVSCVWSWPNVFC